MSYQPTEIPYADASQPADRISIAESGRLGLTQAFATAHGISSATRARLFWDADKQVVFITFTDDGLESAYPVQAVSHGGAYIPARQFFTRAGCDPTKLAGRYRYEVTKAEDVGLPNAERDAYLIDLTRAEVESLRSALRWMPAD